MDMTRRVSLIALCVCLFGALAPVAGAQTSGADLALDLTGPATSPAVGELFDMTLTVSNGGPATADEVFVTNYLPPELELRSAVPMDPAATCYEDGTYPEGRPPEPEPMPTATAQPDGAKASPGSYGGGVSCDLGSLAPGARSVVKVTVERVGARESYSSASVGSITEDPLYENNYEDRFFQADRSKPADVGVTVAGPKAPDVGAAYEYVLTVTNHGPSRADNVRLTDSGGGARLIGFSSSDPADACAQTMDDPQSGYFALECALGSLDPGASTTLRLSVERTSAWEIYNSAYVTTANLDEVYDNDYGDHVIPADPSVTSDLSIRATRPAQNPLVGDTFTTTFTVSNSGPSQAGDVWVSDYLTEGLEFVSVSPADKCGYNSYGDYPYAEGPTAAPAGKEGDAYYPVSPSGLYCRLGTLASGASTDIQVTLTRTKARELWNSAWVSSSNYDPTYENNYSELQLAPDKSKPADLSAAITAPENPPVGSDFDIALSVTNNGPSQADDVTLASYLPYGLEPKSVTPEACTLSGGGEPEPLAPEQDARPAYYGAREVTCGFGSIPPGETQGATLSVTRTTEYEIWTSAWVSGTNYDENYENDYGSLLIAGKPYPGACPAGGGSVEGTKGSDTIVIGDCGSNTKAGNDSVEAAPSSAAGNSAIRTGRGADNISVVLNTSSATRRHILVEAGRGRDTITLTAAPGIGNATVILSGDVGNDNVILDLAPGADRLKVVVRGRDGDDSVVGGSKGVADDLMSGVTIYGGAGRDILEGTDGDDRLFGGASADRLFGGLGDDELDGGRGRDGCRGGPGRDASQRC